MGIERSLEGKVAIVTGASRGTGRAYAQALALAGASVVVAARTDKPAALTDAPMHMPGEMHAGKGARQLAGLLPGSLQETVASIEEAGGTAMAVRCDVGNEDDVRAMAQAALDHFGRIDVMVSNAGIFPRFNTLEVTPEMYEAVFRVNMLGPYLCAKHVLPHMIERGSGSVINITTGSPDPTASGRLKSAQGIICYTTTKHGLNRQTQVLAREMAQHGVAVNALAPGMILTEGGIETNSDDYDFMGEFPRDPCTPELIGPALLYLANVRPDVMTGQILFTVQFGETWGVG